MRPTDFIEHPEGGRYREVYRSQTRIQYRDKGDRSVVTHIYFSLNSGEVSRFHRLGSDEVWSLYRGEGLRLYLWDGVSSRADRVELSVKDEAFCHVVPAGVWQAAVPLRDAVLVGCSVAPGFEFADFELLSRESEEGRRLLIGDPKLKKFALP